MTAVRHVTYFPPFTHYLTADLLRVSIVAGAAVAAPFLLLLAVRRWGEDRRSSSLFLIGFVFSLAVSAPTSIVGLGHPPVWGLLVAQVAAVGFAFAAGWTVPGEVRRAVRARKGNVTSTGGALR